MKKYGFSASRVEILRFFLKKYFFLQKSFLQEKLMFFVENVPEIMPKNIVVRNLAWLRPLELIFGEKFTARRAESEFDTFEPFFGFRFFFAS